MTWYETETGYHDAAWRIVEDNWPEWYLAFGCPGVFWMHGYRGEPYSYVVLPQCRPWK